MIDPPWATGPWARPPRDPQAADLGPIERLVATVRRAVRPRRGSVDARVLVTGTVGTSTVTECLCAVLDRRGHATRVVTVTDGEPPVRGGDARGAVETLVVDVPSCGEAIQNAVDRLGPPDVVVVTAVGRDGLATGSPRRGDVVRAIAGAVPADAHVVNAEGSPAVRRYLATAIERRGATISHVGAHDADAPGAELGSAIDGALAAVEEAPMPDEEREALADASRPEWLELPGGRCYDAVGVTDAVALERLRRALVADREPVEFVVACAEERRDVAATIAEYASECHERRAIATVHVLGPGSRQFAEHCAAPTVDHGPDAGAAAVLDDALAAGPTIVTGVAETAAGAAMETAVTERIERSGAPRIG